MYLNMSRFFAWYQQYMADEARSLKAYGELPENIRVNEQDTFEDEDENDDYVDFDDTQIDVDEI